MYEVQVMARPYPLPTKIYDEGVAWSVIHVTFVL